jgi:DNA invertase Pin-like site-specific DNA recombinase
MSCRPSHPAKAKGKKLGAPEKTNKKLIKKLLTESRMSYSKIANLANCSKATVCRVAKSLNLASVS